MIPPELIAMHRSTMDIVDANDVSAVSSCFTSDYGRSINNTGSYLRRSDHIRYFSPTEILRQLALPQSFAWPEAMPRETAWRLAGSCLSVPAARHILDAIPGLVSRRSRIACA